MKKTFKVPNISCDHCVGTIRRELSEMEGVRSVVGDATSKTVTLEFDEEETSWAEVLNVLEEIHYPAENG